LPRGRGPSSSALRDTQPGDMPRSNAQERCTMGRSNFRAAAARRWNTARMAATTVYVQGFSTDLKE
jgi:hypothetical protein